MPLIRKFLFEAFNFGGCLTDEPAGLLKQPRARRGALGAALPPEEDPMHLKKRVEQLERELKLAEDLIAVLRELPGNKDRVPPPGAKKKTAKPNSRRRRRTSGEKKSLEGASSADGGSLAG